MCNLICWLLFSSFFVSQHFAAAGGDTFVLSGGYFSSTGPSSVSYFNSMGPTSVGHFSSTGLTDKGHRFGYDLILDFRTLPWRKEPVFLSAKLSKFFCNVFFKL